MSNVVETEIPDNRSEVDSLRRENRDLQITLAASNQHRDSLQEQLHGLNTSLTAEVRGHQTSEEKLQHLIQAIRQEKDDLEVLVQILIDQGDHSAEDAEAARIDGLTQIANRRRFDEYLKQEWARHARIQQPLSLLLCDVDHFKLYNDSLGHQAGDECLKRVATLLGTARRTSDLVARYGGEEFALVLPHTDLAGALLVAERVRSAVAAANLPHASSPVCDRVTLSIGVASTVPLAKYPIMDASLLVEEADRNLYLAKRGGRNRVGHHGDGSRSTVTRETFGSYGDRPGECEYLALAFSPLSAPLHSRWRNNGLSADFLGDYVITFLPRENGAEATESWQKWIKHAVTFVANELLENAMKYHARDIDIPIGIRLELTSDHIRVSASNGIGAKQAQNYKAFVEHLQNGKASDLLLQQQEQSAMGGETTSSGLGILTMMSDWGAQVGWCFETHPLKSEVATVTTSAILPLTDGLGAPA
jgi:diguanylate cyclase (GGDEF)-like protein